MYIAMRVEVGIRAAMPAMPTSNEYSVYLQINLLPRPLESLCMVIRSSMAPIGARAIVRISIEPVVPSFAAFLMVLCWVICVKRWLVPYLSNLGRGFMPFGQGGLRREIKEAARQVLNRDFELYELRKWYLEHAPCLLCQAQGS